MGAGCAGGLQQLQARKRLHTRNREVCMAPNSLGITGLPEDDLDSEVEGDAVEFMTGEFHDRCSMLQCVVFG